MEHEEKESSSQKRRTQKALGKEDTKAMVNENERVCVGTPFRGGVYREYRFDSLSYFCFPLKVAEPLGKACSLLAHVECRERDRPTHNALLHLALERSVRGLECTQHSVHSKS